MSIPMLTSIIAEHCEKVVNINEQIFHRTRKCSIINAAIKLIIFVAFASGKKHLLIVQCTGIIANISYL